MRRALAGLEGVQAVRQAGDRFEVETTTGGPDAPAAVAAVAAAVVLPALRGRLARRLGPR